MIALATSSAHPALDADDRPLLLAFRERGIEAVPVIWDDSTVDWRKFESVIVRNTWDYIRKLAAFHQWLQALPVPLWNPRQTILRNTDKTYLRDWEAKGISIVPSAWLDADSRATLRETLAARGWREAVLKPLVSAGSHRTHRLSAENVDGFEPELRELRQAGGALLQPYLPEIEQEGEWSFIFFAGRLSHVVLKKPASGDFRAHVKFGGHYQRQDEVPDAFVEQARRALAPVGDELLYARVDMVRRDDTLLLSELEITEPSLYFAQCPQAPRAFVEAYLRLSR